MTKQLQTYNPHVGSFQSTKSEDLMVVLHLGDWIVLCVGFWHHRELAMSVGSILTIANFTNFLSLLVTTICDLLIALPFEAKTAAGIHMPLFLLMASIPQVGQIMIFLPSAAPH